MSGFDLGDYVPVAERIVTFYELFPTGRIVCTPPEPIAVNGNYFIGSTCSVWKTQAAEQPDSVASAWEPYPGKTPYTRDSEAMNAETSAIGRALGAAGIAVKRSLATSDEVQLRQGTPDGVPRAEAKSELVAACDGDTALAKWWWHSAWANDPDRVPREELETVLRLVAASAADASPSGGGDGTQPEAEPGADRETPAEVPESETDVLVEGEAGGSTHPAGPPSKAAREALERSRP